MEYRQLHAWNLSPEEAVRAQNGLRALLKIVPYGKTPKLIAGADISFEKDSDVIFAVFVVLDAKTLQVVGTSHSVTRVQFPYVPGLLSFREIPPLLEAWKRLKLDPDVVVFDGQGIAHPRRLGIASHMGLLIEKPTIGCGKTKLCGTFEELGPEPGSYTPLIHKNEKVGYALRTKLRTNPVFISPGNLMDQDSALRIIRACHGGYRIPEPTRQAHLYANRLRVEARDSDLGFSLRAG